MSDATPLYASPLIAVISPTGDVTIGGWDHIVAEGIYA